MKSEMMCLAGCWQSLSGLIRVALGVMAFLLSCLVEAHDSRPIVVSVSQSATNEFHLQTTVPGSVASTNLPSVSLSEGCLLTAPATVSSEGSSYRLQSRFRCGSDSADQSLEIRFPQSNPSLSTIIRFQKMDQPLRTQLLGPGETRWQLSADHGSSWSIAAQYTKLGMVHIAGGIDHLLYVLCLIWLARTPKRILLTVSGFTLAHSVTLALATFQWLTPDPMAIEASIALSIVFLVTEIARGEQQKTLVWRYPVLISSMFGLLHGFGFAGALREVGLPESEVPLALLTFNLGVELGQLLFISLILVSGWLLLSVVRLPAWPHYLRQLSVYAVGSVSGFWLVERTVAMFA